MGHKIFAKKVENQKLFICIDKDPLARIAIMTSLFRTKITFYLKAMVPAQLDYFSSIIVIRAPRANNFIAKWGP